jgi:hypothetical protein
MSIRNRRIIVSDEITNEGRCLLPRTVRGLFEMFVAQLAPFEEPNVERMRDVVNAELSKIEAGRIKVSRGLREELNQVSAAIARYLTEE